MEPVRIALSNVLKRKVIYVGRLILASISFCEDGTRSWVAAGWSFRYVLEQASARHPNDRELADTLRRAADVGYLEVPRLGPALATRVTESIISVAANVSDLDEEFVDEKVNRSWRESMTRLLRAAKQGGEAVG